MNKLYTPTSTPKMSSPNIGTRTRQDRFQPLQRLCFALVLMLLMSSSALVLAGNGIETDDDGGSTLFTFGDQSVSLNEFRHVYEKHNMSDSTLYTQQSVDEYLELYINFKLKVAEAERLGLDTVKEIREQLAGYRAQLSKSYLYDKDISEKLVKEAYDRMKEEIKVSHLLIRVDPSASPTDTLQAYKRLMGLRDQLVKGGKMAEIAEKHSQDPSAKENKGDLGYITVFQTVYPFESAAYNTPVGEYSQPVRTKYGYHILKVEDRRAARGKVKVAHVLLRADDRMKPEEQAVVEKKANEIYKQLTKGKIKFSEAAKAHSQDKQSAMRGGELEWFGSGQMLESFEDAAFGLENLGDIAKPVKTPIGFHIIKLLNVRKVGSFDDAKREIRSRIERDSRSQVSKQVFFNRLKKDYQFEEENANLKMFTNQVTDEVLKSKWRNKEVKYAEKVLFRLSNPNEKKATAFNIGQFAHFVERNQRQGKTRTVQGTVNNLYRLFVEQELIAIEETLLETKYPEFGRLMKEFRDGTLLFDLTEDKVWNFAIKDSVGLEKFYNANKDNYQWKERVRAAVFTAREATMIPALRLRVETAKEEDLATLTKSIEKEFNVQRGSQKAIRAEYGVYEKGANTTIDQVKWKKGVSEEVALQSGHVTFAKITEVLDPAPKKLDEAKGYVVADYQAQLEDEWEADLRKQYPVKISEKVLKSVYGREPLKKDK